MPINTFMNRSSVIPVALCAGTGTGTRNLY
jgi:hypothetical protein